MTDNQNLQVSHTEETKKVSLAEAAKRMLEQKKHATRDAKNQQKHLPVDNQTKKSQQTKKINN